MMKMAFKADKAYNDRIFDKLRENINCTPSQLFAALETDEKLLGRSVESNAILLVNALHSTVSVHGECDLHGPGHSNAECRLLTSGKVVWDPAKSAHVYKDSGDVFKRKAPPSDGVIGSSSKKTKVEPKFHQGQGPTKDKKSKFNKDWNKQEKEVSKDKKEKQKGKQEKKKHKKVGKVIDDLKTTIVSLIQSQSSSSSAAAAPAQAPAPAGPPTDGTIFTAIDKHFADLKKSFGFEP